MSNSSLDRTGPRHAEREDRYERPWEKWGAVRRDCEPHRGASLLLLATASVLLGVLGCCLCFPTFVGLPCALTACLLAGRDLKRMRAGLMDRGGWGETETAWHRSIDGVVLNTPWCFWAILALIRLLGEIR